jgi:hypothetical protein
MRCSRLLLAFAFGLPVAAVAHHGWNEYDAARPVALTGTVEAVEFANPHSRLKLKAAAGSWLVILAPPSRMEARGLTRDRLAVGATITVEGFPHKSKADEMRAERLAVDGTTVDLR